jgi:HlyD family secretion protein
MSRRKKTIIWIIVALVVIGGYFLLRPKAPATVYTTADVTRGNLAQTVSVTGNLVDNEEINLNFEIGGRIKTIFARKGMQFAAGEILAVINDADLSKQVEEAKALYDKALADAGSNNDAVRESEVAVENAEDTLDATKDLNDRNIDAADQAVTNAGDYKDDAQSYYNQEITDHDAGSAEAKSAKLTLTTAENELEAARKAEKTADETADLAEVNAENTLNAAEAKLKTAQSEFGERSRDASVANAKAGYDQALYDLTKTALKAPVNGKITEVNNKIGEVIGSITTSQSGQIGAPFAKMISNDLVLESNVPESDIVKLKMGEKASVTFDALTPQDIFDGEVIEIDPASTVIQDVVYYQIKLRMASVDQRLKPGMSANINIHTAERDNILMIPLRAVQTEGNQQFAQILNPDGKTTTKVQVKTGLEGDEGMVEITSGLTEGQKVVTFAQTQ